MNLTEANRGSFPPGTLLTYGCEPGYAPDGPSSITCTSSGAWSHLPPRCIRTNGKIPTDTPRSTSPHPHPRALC